MHENDASILNLLAQLDVDESTPVAALLDLLSAEIRPIGETLLGREVPLTDEQARGVEALRKAYPPSEMLRGPS